MSVCGICRNEIPGLFRDHTFETCHSAVKVQRDNAESDNVKLKAELEDRDKRLGECLAQGIGTTIDRDARASEATCWKALAGRMAEALNIIVVELNQERVSEMKLVGAKALADYEPAVKENGNENKKDL